MSAATKEGRVLLDPAVTAQRYELTLTPNLAGNFKYEGHVLVELKLAEARSSITLHSKELEMIKCAYGASKDAASADTATVASETTFDLKLMTVTYTFATPLAAGTCFLKIDFVGTHNNQMNGFYRFDYKDRDGKAIVGASTQFESIDARKCFPCIDEPSQKSVFSTTLVVDKMLTVLSNMPESSNVPEGDAKKRVTFEDSPKMSTYLLAFCVGQFDYVEGRSEHGVLCRVYTPEGKSHLGKFSLDVGIKCLDLYDDTFGCPFPLPKLDQIAIPEFAMGAMENWGLVTYRSIDLMVDEETASSQQKQRVATVVTHELAHQWFGNLVTMAWWDDLWLNEGFASWTQSYATDFIFPEFSMWEQFVTNEQAGALRMDSLVSSHPIQVPIKHAEEVEQVFDAISYLKGASIVRMLRAFLGDSFFTGLKAYMAKFRYGNTETSDLWGSWEEVSGKPVTEVMKSWTEQMGYPVLSVNSSEWTPQELTLKDVTQEWFLADGSKPDGFDDKLWHIPMIICVGNAQGKTLTIDVGLMKGRTETIKVPLPAGFCGSGGEDGLWYKLNGEQHIPMRVWYPEADRASMAQAVQTKQMCTQDRAGLIQDAFALAKSGRMDVGDLLVLISAYKNEDTLPVWEGLQSTLLSLKSVLMNVPELHERFLVLGRDIVKPAADKSGWEATADDGHLGKMLRALLVQLQEKFMGGDPTVVKEANSRYTAFKANVEDTSALSSEYRAPVLRIALGNAADPEAALAELLVLVNKAKAETSTTTPVLKDMYLSMGAVKSVEAKRKVLDFATSGEMLAQDFFYPIASVSASGPEGLELAWTYLRENFAKAHAIVANASPSLLAALVTVSTSGFATMERATEIEEFFQSKDVPLISRKIDQICENIRSNAAFLDMVKKSTKLNDVLPKAE